MAATVRDLTAQRRGSTVRLTGTVDAPQDGWTVKVEADNPGVAGEFDTEYRVKITAEAPPIGPDILTQEPIDETLNVNAQDTTVAVRLIGLNTKDGAKSVPVPIQD